MCRRWCSHGNEALFFASLKAKKQNLTECLWRCIVKDSGDAIGDIVVLIWRWLSDVLERYILGESKTTTPYPMVPWLQVLGWKPLSVIPRPGPRLLQDNVRPHMARSLAVPWWQRHWCCFLDLLELNQIEHLWLEGNASDATSYHHKLSFKSSPIPWSRSRSRCPRTSPSFPDLASTNHINHLL